MRCLVVFGAPGVAAVSLRLTSDGDSVTGDLVLRYGRDRCLARAIGQGGSRQGAPMRPVHLHWLPTGRAGSLLCTRRGCSLAAPRPLHSP